MRILIILLCFIMSLACKKKTEEEEVVSQSDQEKVLVEEVNQQEPAQNKTPTLSSPNATPTSTISHTPSPVVSSSPPSPLPVPERPKVIARPPMPDLRLIMTINDVMEVAKGKVSFRRTELAGAVHDEDTDALYFEPEKGTSFGFALQVFRGRDMEMVRNRYSEFLASYPNSQEITPISGKTFFAYWGEVLFIGFVQPSKYMVVIVSCGRNYCDSDGLYELAKKISSRLG